MPTFETDKTYRTLHGRTAQLCNVHTGTHQPYRLFVRGDVVWAYADGSFSFFGQMDKMLPGSIEDEKPAQVIPFWQRMENELTSLKLTVGELTGRADERIDNLEKHCEAMQARFDAFVLEYRGRINNHGTRLMNLQDRITAAEVGMELLAQGQPQYGAYDEARDGPRRGTISQPKPVRDRKLYRIAYDGFEGFKVGEYTTLKGEPGVVLQIPDTNIVHVYKAKHIEGQ